MLFRPPGYVYAIEFQIRVVAHAHILIILCDSDILRDTLDYDRIVFAELPDPIVQTRLHTIVKHCMIHVLCGVAKRNAPCLPDGWCSKRYPKAFSLVIINGEDDYPVYCRRDNGRFVNVGGAQLDNRWVQPIPVIQV